MADDVLTTMLRQSGISFVGSVVRLRAATMSDVPVDDHTAVVHVERVLEAPPSLAHLAGQDVTVQLAADGAAVGVGERLALFTNAAVLGQSLAVTEVGRLPASAVEPHPGLVAMVAASPVAHLRRQIDADDLRRHADSADAVVVGKITKLEEAAEPRLSEHAPQYWRATLQVQHVEKGDVSGPEVTFVYPASRDVRWVGAPKPQAGQVGMWILHAATGAVRDLAPFELAHSEDYRPVQHLDSLRQPGP